MFQISSETYDEVKGALEDVLKELEEIHEITINGKKYKIKFMVGGDMKMLAYLFGINAANSHYPCIWCNFCILNLLSENDEFHISRTQEQAAYFWKEESEGYCKEPIIKFIEFDCCIMDTLHLFLRISDKLFELLLQKINLIDGDYSSDFSKRPLLKIYVDFLKNTCKLTKPYYIKDKQINFRSLSGKERLRIFEKFFGDFQLMSNFFPADKINLETEDICWGKFYSIFNSIKSFKTDDEFGNNENDSQFDDKLNELKADLKAWLGYYQQLNNGQTITPYIHGFVFHIPEFLEKYKDVNIFNLQGLEKMNDLTTQYYHNSTNKHSVENEYLLQLLNKRNRIEFYNLEGNLSDFYY